MKRSFLLGFCFLISRLIIGQHFELVPVSGPTIDSLFKEPAYENERGSPTKAAINGKSKLLYLTFSENENNDLFKEFADEREKLDKPFYHNYTPDIVAYNMFKYHDIVEVYKLKEDAYRLLVFTHFYSISFYDITVKIPKLGKIIKTFDPIESTGFVILRNSNNHLFFIQRNTGEFTDFEIPNEFIDFDIFPFGNKLYFTQKGSTVGVYDVSKGKFNSSHLITKMEEKNYFLGGPYDASSRTFMPTEYGNVFIFCPNHGKDNISILFCDSQLNFKRKDFMGFKDYDVESGITDRPAISYNGENNYIIHGIYLKDSIPHLFIIPVFANGNSREQIISNSCKSICGYNINIESGLTEIISMKEKTIASIRRFWYHNKDENDDGPRDGFAYYYIVFENKETTSSILSNQWLSDYCKQNKIMNNVSSSRLLTESRYGDTLCYLGIDKTYGIVLLTLINGLPGKAKTYPVSYGTLDLDKLSESEACALAEKKDYIKLDNKYFRVVLKND